MFISKSKTDPACSALSSTSFLGFQVFVNFAQEQTDDTDHNADMDSSSGGSSGGSAVMKDQNLHKSITGGSYAYMNPEYSSGPMDSFDTVASPPPVGLMAFDNNAYEKELSVTKL